MVSTRSVDIAICSHTPSKYLLGPSRPSTEIRGTTEGYWAWMVSAPGTKGPCLIPNRFFPLLGAVSRSWSPSRWRKFFQEVGVRVFSLWLQLLTSLGFLGLPVRGTLLVTRDSLRTPRKWCSPALYPDSELHLREGRRQEADIIRLCLPSPLSLPVTCQFHRGFNSERGQ